MIMNISLTKEEKSEFDKDAKFMGLSLSKFVRKLRRDWKQEKTKNIPRYKYAVEWIAFNDEPGELSLSFVASLISVQLIADLFGIAPEVLAKDVIQMRREDIR